MKPVHHRDPKRITDTERDLGEYARRLTEAVRSCRPFGDVLEIVLAIYELGVADGKKRSGA